MKIRKPLYDKIILVDIILGVAMVGSMVGLIYVPTWAIIVLVAIAILLELASRGIQQLTVANLWELATNILKSNEKKRDESD